MPSVEGRLDHLSVDIKRKRLFIAALGNNQNTVEVIDLRSGKEISRVPGQSMPQGVFYSGLFDRLYVANGNDGTCKIFRGDNFKLIDSMKIGLDANHVGYDATTKLLYVGSGDARTGALSIIDIETNRHVGDIKTDARPGGIMIERSRPRIFVTLAGTPNLAVVDRKEREEITTWPVPGVRGNVALAQDEPHHRLFAGSRLPPVLSVLDTESGKLVSQLEGVPGIDGLWYDATRSRIYASGGRGFAHGLVYVYQQKDNSHYQLIAKVTSASGAGTSLWVPELDRYYVAAPAINGRVATILIFAPL